MVHRATLITNLNNYNIYKSYKMDSTVIKLAPTYVACFGKFSRGPIFVVSAVDKLTAKS